MSYQHLPDQTRVWIYQSNRPFNTDETTQLRPVIARFAKHWVSHNQQLKAFGDIFRDQFIVLMVDESQAGASGCSIDTSVHFIKEVEQALGVSLFDRMTFTYLDGDQIHTAPREQFAQLYAQGKINDETMVFDNLVKNKKEFEQTWLKPLKDSWHKRMV